MANTTIAWKFILKIDRDTVNKALLLYFEDGYFSFNKLEELSKKIEKNNNSSKILTKADANQ